MKYGMLGLKHVVLHFAFLPMKFFMFWSYCHIGTHCRQKIVKWYLSSNSIAQKSCFTNLFSQHTLQSFLFVGEGGGHFSLVDRFVLFVGTWFQLFGIILINISQILVYYKVCWDVNSRGKVTHENQEHWSPTNIDNYPITETR